MNIYFSVFCTFLKIGLFNFGGGYPMISFIQNEVVFKHAWLTNTQFTDIVAISQMTPGPVGINMATCTGYAATGSAWGAALATLAVCLPSLFIMILLAGWFLKHRDNPAMQAVFKGLRPAIVGLIAAAALLLCDKQNFVGISSIVFFVVSFVLLHYVKLHPIFLIILAGAASWLVY